MTQIRCAQTSELLAEGTPLEIATLAEAFESRDVIFDGVTEGFDPAAVRKFRAGEIDGLSRALAEMTTPAKATAEERERVDAQRRSLEATIKERRDRIAAGAGMADDARRRMTEARDRVAERRGGA